MSSLSPASDDRSLTPEQRRRNSVLGTLLLALVLVIMGTWMIIFARHGLPQDPQEVKRLQAQAQDHQPEPAAERPAR